MSLFLTTNESLWLIGWVSPHNAGLTTANESFWLVGGLSFPSNHDAGTNDHQRVITTRWLGLPPRRRPTLTCIYRYTMQRQWQMTIRGTWIAKRTCRTTTATTITTQGLDTLSVSFLCTIIFYYLKFYLQVSYATTMPNERVGWWQQQHRATRRVAQVCVSLFMYFYITTLTCIYRYDDGKQPYEESVVGWRRQWLQCRGSRRRAPPSHRCKSLEYIK